MGHVTKHDQGMREYAGDIYISGICVNRSVGQGPSDLLRGLRVRGVRGCELGVLTPRS
jgi:hypothetical protein